MKILYRWSFLRWLFGDTRAQVVFSVVVGVSLSLITFLCCNMLIVKVNFHYHDLKFSKVLAITQTYNVEKFLILGRLELTN